MNIHTRSILRRSIIIFFVITLFAVTLTENISFAAIRTPRLNVKTLSLVKGKSYKLRLYNTSSDHTITFESDDSTIAEIKNAKKNSCSIKAKSSGLTYVTAYITDNTTEDVTELKCKVTVTPAAVTIKFNKKKMKLQLGTSKRAKISIKPSTSLELPRFSSDDPDIASVSSNGTVTANKTGNTVIRVSIGNGKAAICKIIVKDNKNKNNNNSEEKDNKDNNSNKDTADDNKDNKDTEEQHPTPKPSVQGSGSSSTDSSKSQNTEKR